MATIGSYESNEQPSAKDDGPGAPLMINMSPDEMENLTGESKEGDQMVRFDDHGNAIKEPGQASMFSSIMNLSNTILGAGILGLPHAFASSGYVLGSAFLVFFACTSTFGLHLLADVSVRRHAVTRDASFYNVAQAAFSKGALVIDVAVAIKCFGVSTAYLIVIGDLLPPAMKAMGLSGLALDRRLVITILQFAIIAPLCTLRRLDGLRFTSTMSILFVTFTSIVLLTFSADKDLDVSDRGSTEHVVFNYGTLTNLPVFIFGYTCQQNIFSISNDLKHLTMPRMNAIIGTSISTGLITYLVIAISGYYVFGDAVKANVLNNYPSHPLITTARLMMSLLVTFGYPLQCFPSRYSILSIIKNVLGPPQDARMENRRWMIVTLCFCILSWFIAMIINDLGKVLAVVGATGSTTISYILPGYTYFKLQREWTLKKGFALALFILGVITIPCTLTFIFLE